MCEPFIKALSLSCRGERAEKKALDLYGSGWHGGGDGFGKFSLCLSPAVRQTRLKSFKLILSNQKLYLSEKYNLGSGKWQRVLVGIYSLSCFHFRGLMCHFSQYRSLKIAPPFCNYFCMGPAWGMTLEEMITT